MHILCYGHIDQLVLVFGHLCIFSQVFSHSTLLWQSTEMYETKPFKASYTSLIPRPFFTTQSGSGNETNQTPSIGVRTTQNVIMGQVDI